MARERDGNPIETHINISSTAPGIGTIPLEESAFWNALAERGRHVTAALVSLTPDETGRPPLVRAANYWKIDEDTLFWASQSLQSLVAGRETPAIAALRREQARRAGLEAEKKMALSQRLVERVKCILSETVGNPFGLRDLEQGRISKERLWE